MLDRKARQQLADLVSDELHEQRSYLRRRLHAMRDEGVEKIGIYNISEFLTALDFCFTPAALEDLERNIGWHGCEALGVGLG